MERSVGLWKDRGSDPMEGLRRGVSSFNLDFSLLLWLQNRLKSRKGGKRETS